MKTAGRGTFKCQECQNWTHANCGGYGKHEIQQEKVGKLTCNDFSVIFSRLVHKIDLMLHTMKELSSPYNFPTLLLLLCIINDT